MPNTPTHGPEVLDLTEMLQYQDGSVVSRVIQKGPSGTITLFAFAAGEGLSEHTTPYNALLQVLEGEADIGLEGKVERVAAGRAVLLPANRPHSVHAAAQFKMLLTMLKA